MVRVRYSFGSRHTGQISNINKQRKKYPKILDEVVEKSDIILEVLDARFVEETRNFEVERLIKKKKRKIIYVLNKMDLIDKDEIEKKLKIRPYAFISCAKRQGSVALRGLIRRMAKDIQPDKDGKIFVGIIGYPNTGKSSIINFLTGRSVAKIGNEAGFTKGMQKVKFTNEISILDTPGVIADVQYSMDDSKKLIQQTKVGARSYNKVKDPDLVVQGLLNQYENLFQKHYDIKNVEDSDDFLEILGRRRGFLKKGDNVDLDRTARVVLKDWQNGVIRV